MKTPRTAAPLAFLLTASLLTGARTNGAQTTSPPHHMTRTNKSANAKHKAGDEADLPVVLIFPTDTKNSVAAGMATDIGYVEQDRLGISGGYNTVFFLRSLPTIQRAVDDREIPANVVKPPFMQMSNEGETDPTILLPQKAARITRRLGHPLMLLSSLDNYDYDPDAKKAKFTLLVRLYDVAGTKPQLVKEVKLDYSGPQNVSKSAKEEDVARLAGKDGAEKAMTQFLGPPPAPTPKKH